MRDRIGGLIESISAEVEDLPELAERWDELDDDQRFLTAYDWDLVVMGDLLKGLSSNLRKGCGARLMSPV